MMGLKLSRSSHLTGMVLRQSDISVAVRYEISVRRKGSGNEVTLEVEGKAISGTVIPLPSKDVTNFKGYGLYWPGVKNGKESPCYNIFPFLDFEFLAGWLWFGCECCDAHAISNTGKKNLYCPTRRYCNKCGVIWTCHSLGFGNSQFPDGWACGGCLCSGE